MITLSAFKAHPEIPKLAKEAGLGLEFSGLINPIHYSAEFIKSVKDLEHFNLFNSVHGPFYDLIPASLDPEVQELAKVKFMRAIDATKELNIKHLIFHTGWLPYFYSDDIWVKNSIEFWKGIMDYCGDSINIHLENVKETNPLLIKDIIKGVDRKNFDMCLDIGHVYLENGDKVDEWIDELHEVIGHVHIHNNFGSIDDHNGLDEGHLDIERVLAKLKEKCPRANWNMEIRTNFKKSIEIIKKYK